MMSVIVPTHNPAFLQETLSSVLAQTAQDFEIVVVPNGQAKVESHLPPDRRIRVVPYQGTGAVGAVKRFAFGQAKGDILVELDHDDLLVPDALETIAGAFQGGCDFVYSNFAIMKGAEGKPEEYDPYFGWKARDLEVMGRKLREMVAFPPSPASIGHVWYAPNHVRAWKKDCYMRIGGHNPGLGVCDDHDLVVRTYLSGEMKHIDRCLYLYRDHGGNTVWQRNQEIQQKTQAIYAESIENLVLHWATKAGLKCYDLGGQHNPKFGWTSVDLEGAQVIADLRKPWPWPDSSVGAFRAYDFLEHLPDKMFTMQEIHRCLVPGGWILTFTPSALGQGAFQDPTHVSYWVKNSFLYYGHKDYARYIGNTKYRFQTQRLVEEFPNQWHERERIPYITWDGICLKDGYNGPGPNDW